MVYVYKFLMVCYFDISYDEYLVFERLTNEENLLYKRNTYIMYIEVEK